MKCEVQPPSDKPPRQVNYFRRLNEHGRARAAIVMRRHLIKKRPVRKFWPLLCSFLNTTPARRHVQLFLSLALLELQSGAMCYSRFRLVACVRCLQRQVVSRLLLRPLTSKHGPATSLKHRIAAFFVAAAVRNGIRRRRLLQKRRRRHAAAAYLFFSLFPPKVRVAVAAAVAVGLPVVAGIIFACLSSVADAREGGISFRRN